MVSLTVLQPTPVLCACREYVFYGLLGAAMHMLEILPLASLLLGLFNTPLVPGEALAPLRCLDLFCKSFA